MLRMKMFCSTPPRIALDFKRSAHTRFGLLISQFSTNTLLQLPGNLLAADGRAGVTVAASYNRE